MGHTLARTPVYGAIDDPWRRFLRKWPAGKPADVEALVAWVIRQAHLDISAESDLQRAQKSLQGKQQQDNSQYTALSNVMKTMQDTARQTISNTR